MTDLSILNDKFYWSHSLGSFLISLSYKWETFIGDVNNYMFLCFDHFLTNIMSEKY